MPLGKMSLIGLCGLLLNTTAWASATQSTKATVSDVMQYVPAIGAAGYSVYRHDTAGLWQLSEQLVASTALTFALKEAFNETSLGRRPDGGTHSFPSGHTAFACSGAAYLGQRYGWETAVPAYAVAAYVGYSRIDLHKHHLRDVVAGCAASYGTSLLIVHHYAPSTVSIEPVVESNMLGLQLNARW